MVQQPQRQSVELVEQRSQVTSNEQFESTKLDQPMLLDVSQLRQIGGGSTTEIPNRGW